MVIWLARAKLQKCLVSAERNIFLMLSIDDNGDFLDDHRAGWRGFRKTGRRFCDPNAGGVVDCPTRPLTRSRECRKPSISFPIGARMGDVINLKRFKKRTERAQSAKRAESNRARFGRTKSERALDEKRA